MTTLTLQSNNLCIVYITTIYSYPYMVYRRVKALVKTDFKKNLGSFCFKLRWIGDLKLFSIFTAPFVFFLYLIQCNVGLENELIRAPLLGLAKSIYYNLNEILSWLWLVKGTDDAAHWINLHTADGAVHSVHTFPLDSDLFICTTRSRLFQ